MGRVDRHVPNLERRLGVLRDFLAAGPSRETVANASLEGRQRRLSSFFAAELRSNAVVARLG